MTVFGRMPAWIAAACGACVRLANDRRGVAAVEFAFIAPLLLVMYFITAEVAQGIATNKKVGRVASIVADLITQQDKVTGAELDAILQIGDAIVQPYSRTTPKIIARAIEITPAPNSQVRVLWTRTRNGSADAACTSKPDTVTVPPALNVPNTFLIQVKTELCYKPMIAWSDDQKAALGLMSAFAKIEMKESYYLRPRMSTTIPCTTGC